jgi:hypothetical protein
MANEGTGQIPGRFPEGIMQSTKSKTPPERRITMSNLNTTIVQSNNPEVLKACARSISASNIAEDVYPVQGGIELVVKTLNCIPHDEVLKVSRRFPDEVITCRHVLNRANFSEIQIVEYCNGQNEVKAIEPIYWYNHLSLSDLVDQGPIFDKVYAFFSLIDRTKENEDGKLVLNWFDEEVRYRFQHEDSDGKKYLIEATKIRNQIDFMAFEALGGSRWKITSEPDLIGLPNF